MWPGLRTASGLFGRVYELKAPIGGRFLAMRAGYRRTALRNLRSVRPKRIVKKIVGLRFNFTVAEYSIAVVAVQSPLRHAVTFSEAWFNHAKTRTMEVFRFEHSESWPIFSLFATGQIFGSPE